MVYNTVMWFPFYEIWQQCIVSLSVVFVECFVEVKQDSTIIIVIVPVLKERQQHKYACHHFVSYVLCCL